MTRGVFAGGARGGAAAECRRQPSDRLLPAVEPVRQSDGGIIAAGVVVEGTYYFGVSRPTPEGEPDLAFGVDGVTAPIEDLPIHAGPRGRRLPDDTIIAAAVRSVTGAFLQNGFVVVR